MAGDLSLWKDCSPVPPAALCSTSRYMAHRVMASAHMSHETTTSVLFHKATDNRVARLNNMVWQHTVRDHVIIVSPALTSAMLCLTETACCTTCAGLQDHVYVYARICVIFTRRRNHHTSALTCDNAIQKVHPYTTHPSFERMYCCSSSMFLTEEKVST